MNIYAKNVLKRGEIYNMIIYQESNDFKTRSRTYAEKN